MNLEAAGVFLERIGHRVIPGASCCWYQQGWRFFGAFPHARPIAPDSGELRRLFSASGCFGVRFVSGPADPGRASYALVLDDRAYDLDALSANSRSKVRRGLKECQVRRIDAGFAHAHGRQANEDTLRRIRFAHDVYDWDRYWDAVAAAPDVQVWGALRDTRLLAYLVAVIVGGSAELLIARSADEGLRYYPNNALLFTAARDLLRRPEIDEIVFGLESVERVTGVDTFKESMGFTRRPVRQRVVLRPLAERIARVRATGRIARALARRPRAGTFWRKLEGVLVFHGSLEARLDPEPPVGETPAMAAPAGKTDGAVAGRAVAVERTPNG